LKTLESASQPLRTAVTIAIPTLAAGPLLESCLRALKGQTFRDFDLAIINNGPDPLSPTITTLFPGCHILSPGANVGFAAAVNLAIRATSSPYIATLNDDTEPDPEWLSALIAEMESDPRIGMCASQIRLFETGRLDSAGMRICLDGSSKQRGQSQPPSAYSRSEDVLFPSACAALYRRQLLDEIGLFDEDYFLYCEDTDLGLRARWAGWRCRYVSGATVRHHYSRTAGAVSPLKARFVERNRLWVAIGNFPVMVLIMVPFVSLARYFWQFVALRNQRGAASEFVRAGNSLFTVIGILARAYWETLLHLPSLLRKRAARRSARRIASTEFIRLLRRHRITAKELARV
jgi:GT2 family glycosyltransferase